MGHIECPNHYHTQLIVQAPDGMADTILIREGFTQGEPLSFLVYGLEVLPIIHQLKETFPDIHQPWYADDASSGRWFI